MADGGPRGRDGGAHVVGGLMSQTKRRTLHLPNDLYARCVTRARASSTPIATVIAEVLEAGLAVLDAPTPVIAPLPEVTPSPPEPVRALAASLVLPDTTRILCAGCREVHPRATIAEHAQTCPALPPLPCPGCRVIYRRDVLPAHVAGCAKVADLPAAERDELEG